MRLLKSIWDALQAKFEGKTQSLITYIFLTFTFSFSANSQNLSDGPHVADIAATESPEKISASKIKRQLFLTKNTAKVKLYITDPWLERVAAWDEDAITDKKYRRLVCFYETVDREKIKEFLRIINTANIEFSSSNSSVDIRSAAFLTLDNGVEVKLLVGPPYLDAKKLDGFLGNEDVVLDKTFLYNLYVFAKNLKNDSRCDGLYKKYSDFLTRKN
jgi:hypothetical protein